MLGLDLKVVRGWWSEHQYYQAYFEMVAVGLLPVVFVGISHEPLSLYGFQRKGVLKSIVCSLSVVAIFYLKSFLATGQWIGYASFNTVVNPPWNFFHVLWGIFSNGPLEVFFFIWLVTKSDQILQGGTKILSTGFLGTTLLFGLLHIITTQSLVNALNVFVIFFFLGLIYKWSRNIYGPILGWTLINGMVWAYIELSGIIQ